MTRCYSCTPLIVALTLVSSARGFQINTNLQSSMHRPTTTTLSALTHNKLQSTLATAALCGILATQSLVAAPTAAVAYEDLDAASETVQTVLKSLQEAGASSEKTFAAYENINSIITEGKGVGGNINYKGVQLDRGYISDEDTSIYNPGLALLTETEKQALTKAVISSKKAVTASGQWNNEDQLAFDFLRNKLDPYHTYELGPYIKIFPFYAAIVYLGVLAVQQAARSLFPVAYIAGVVAVFVPALALVALGPQ